MRLSQTRTGKTIVQRQTRNGSYERIGELNTKLNLKDAKAAYASQIEEIERNYNGQPNAIQMMKDAVCGLNQFVEYTENA